MTWGDDVIGKRYWSTGIRIEYTDHVNPAWGGEVDFFDEGWFERPDWLQGAVSIQGHLRTRYFVPSHGAHRDALTVVTDTLLRDAEQLGVDFRDPTIYATGDGEDPEYPLPEDWRELLDEQADRLGWSRPSHDSRPSGWRAPRLRVLD